MGKIYNAIKMLNYLDTGNKYTVKELAKKLNISERMVRYYKAELESCGIAIETFMGPNGGYYIINSVNQYNQFNKYDIELLENVYTVLNKENYIYIDDYKILIDKVKHISDVEEEKSKYFIDKGIEDEKEIYNTMKEAILNKTKLLILYRNFNQEWQERYIHPLQIFKFDNKFYVTAFCELRNAIRHFELDRIKINKK